MPCLLLPLPVQGRRSVVVVCGEEPLLAKKGHSPSSASPSFSHHVSSSPSYGQMKQGVYLPPRLCSLNEFSPRMDSHHSHVETHPGFLKSLLATVELSAQVQNWEVLSGRLAMMVFASALMLEALTGDNVFQKMDSQRLVECCGAAVVSILIAAGSAIALQAKDRVAYRIASSLPPEVAANFAGGMHSRGIPMKPSTALAYMEACFFLRWRYVGDGIAFFRALLDSSGTPFALAVHSRSCVKMPFFHEKCSVI